jgi:hypothetical protein
MLQDAEFPFPTSTPITDEKVLHVGDFDQRLWSEGGEKFFLIESSPERAHCGKGSSHT